jgi:hypothetical protein
MIKIIYSGRIANINSNSRNNNNSILRPLLQLFKSNSTSAISNKTDIKQSTAKISDVKNNITIVDSNSKLDYSTIGRYYQSLVHKGGQGALGLRDLKHLFGKCLEPDHLKYAIKAVEMYQRKGHDFNEEINSLFIKLCITSNNSKAAVDVLSVYKNRLGAWSTPSSLGKLIENMNEKMNTNSTPEDLLALVNLVTVSQMKGVPLTKDILILVLKHTIKQSNIDLYNRLIETGKKSLSKEDFNDIINQFPCPAPKAVEEVKKDEEGGKKSEENKKQNE